MKSIACIARVIVISSKGDGNEAAVVMHINFTEFKFEIIASQRINSLQRINTSQRINSLQRINTSQRINALQRINTSQRIS